MARLVPQKPIYRQKKQKVEISKAKKAWIFWKQLKPFWKVVLILPCILLIGFLIFGEVYLNMGKSSTGDTQQRLLDSIMQERKLREKALFDKQSELEKAQTQLKREISNNEQNIQNFSKRIDDAQSFEQLLRIRSELADQARQQRDDARIARGKDPNLRK